MKMPVEFVLSPPRMFLAFLGAVLLIVVLSMLLKRGSVARKITALVIVLVVIGVVAIMFYRPTVLTVGEGGFVLKRFGERSVAWTEVTEVVRIEDLSASVYRPSGRIAGVGWGSYRVGRFRLRDGGAARVAMQQDRDALLIVTAQQRYLFAMSRNDELFEAVDRFVAESRK